ncbi:MAG: 2-amino-4-hydroxy-6-hydroxymethyldihydropteridine diphosphokinase [Candidatus Woesearchaeota archaeon]|nr:2-amino-4-hydroxy-6-hydroxymethyldihydropteridine diphosphokinase [Candidatus Woesearchaeota archaeon]
MHSVFLGLGSNVGDREQHISDALTLLPVKQVSALYETSPVYNEEQDWFLNCAVEITTELSPQALMQELLKIEAQLGRTRTAKNGPRIIDIDILLYDDLILDEEGLKIPHPGITERLFVLEPLNELCPEKKHPVLKKHIGALHADLDTEQQIKPYNPTRPQTPSRA